jgi:molecular chaperone HscB
LAGSAANHFFVPRMLLDSVMKTDEIRTASVCWSCRAATAGEHFCPACEKIQPLPRGADYFTFFGLPRKLRVDTTDLERRFHRLSWRLHPDNFVRASVRERELSLERSSQLNDAYRTLSDPIRRVEYLLAQAGMRKEGQQKQKAPPELLEEVFELNESLEELRMARKAGSSNGELIDLRKRLKTEQEKFQQSLDAVDAELEGVSGEWDGALDVGAGEMARKELMVRMNKLLNRRSYIRNLVASVRQELAEA